VFRGRGMEFSEVRPYVEGDDPRLIDWNVTARTGHPHVKVFAEERELHVIIAVDLSGSLGFGSMSLTKADRVAEVTALLALAAVRNNDRVGLITFASDVVDYMPAEKGRSHALVLIRKVLLSGGREEAANVDSALSYLGRVLHRRALLFLVSDFLFTSGGSLLRAASGRHDLVGIHVFDPREVSVPDLGLMRFRNPETGLVRVVDTGSARWRRGFMERVAELQSVREQLCRSNRFDLVSISTADDLVLPLRRFFKTRRRRMFH
ncbi:DUF58 domain-containing protein, partial [Candidatus Fermentibacterales bacterium]|nr:DUF58 domain-containing protein [Candidatus Fermentibacterales bacterium]